MSDIVRRTHNLPCVAAARIAAADSPGEALRSAGVVPSKRRGQNFLVQGAVADRIVALADLQSEDEVVEIGPGLGILSERVLATPVSILHLVELDRELAARLRAQLGDRVDLIEGDFLKIDLAQITQRPPIKVVANLPFSVAAAIARKLSEHRELIARMVLMFQREVGERLRAGPGDDAYGALSVLTALDWEIPRHFRVEAGSFHPRPKVNAEVLCFVPRSVPLYYPTPRAEVREVVRAGFAIRRKHLRNALSAGLRLSAERAEAALRAARIDPAQRAEELSAEDFVRLTRALLEIGWRRAPKFPDA
jgi:16S rRNA (adenine1518-N6/adenine1519-N6)-dimethyltransferase